MVCIYVLVDMAHNTEVRRHTKLLAGHYVAIGILRELDQRIGHVESRIVFPEPFTPRAQAAWECRQR